MKDENHTLWAAGDIYYYRGEAHTRVHCVRDGLLPEVD